MSHADSRIPQFSIGQKVRVFATGQVGTLRMVWDDRGLIRGGGCRSGKDAGAFALYAALLHGEYVSVGFRATRPISGGNDA